MKQSFFSLFTAVLLTAILCIVVYTTFFKKTPQAQPKPYDLTYLLPYLNRVDTITVMQEKTKTVYKTLIDTVLVQDTTAADAMADTLLGNDTISRKGSMYLLTLPQFNKVGATYLERDMYKLLYESEEVKCKTLDTIIDEQLTALVEQGGTIDSLNAVVAAEKPKKWRWLTAGFITGFVLRWVVR